IGAPLNDGTQLLEARRREPLRHDAADPGVSRRITGKNLISNDAIPRLLHLEPEKWIAAFQCLQSNLKSGVRQHESDVVVPGQCPGAPCPRPVDWIYAPQAMQLRIGVFSEARCKRVVFDGVERNHGRWATQSNPDLLSAAPIFFVRVWRPSARELG